MKSKKEYILAAIVITALIAYLVVHKTDQTHYEVPNLPELTESDITSITITKADTTIKLKKNDDQWMIYPEKYPADKNKIKPLVDIITSLKITVLVSESTSYHRYELDPENKISIQAGSDDKMMRTFDVGKSAPSNRHTFIKLPDDNRVYHAQGNFRNKFDQTTDALRDKTVLSVEKSQVQEVEIKDKDGNLVLGMKQAPAKIEGGGEATLKPEQTGEKKETKTPSENITPELIWQDADGNPVKEADINNLFNNVSDLKCKSYITGKTKADFTDPNYTITLTGTKTVTLLLFEKINEEDDTYPAISSENDYPFMLPAYKMDNMVKK